MSDAPVVGSAAFELRATKQKLGEDIKAAERDLKAAMGQVEQDAERSSKNIGSSMNRMTRGIALGFTALAATFATGLAMALKFGQASLKMADDLANSARRINMSTTALQEWQHVARRTGEEANSVGADLEKFGLKFAQAQAGISKEAAKPFKRLLLEQDDLRKLKDTEAALDEVMSRIGALKEPNDRQAIAEQLGLGSLATAARDGADEIDRLRNEAAALGFVMDAELIQKGADAQGQLDDLSHVVGIQMAEAFINLSDEVLNFTSQIADAINALSDFIDKSQVAKRVSGVGFGDALGMAASPMGLVKGLVKIGRFAINGPNLVNTDALEDLASGTGRYAPQRTPRRLSSGGSPTLSDLPGRTRTDRSADREARRAERVEQEILRLRQRALGIVDEELLTVQERFDLAKKQVEMEREAEAKELESRLARKDITQAEFNQLKLIQTQTATLEDRVSSDILARDLADERLAKERALTDLTADLLSLQSSAARSATERRDIERRLLAMAQQRAREDLERDLSRTPGLSDADKQARRDALGQVQGAQSAAVDRQNMTPLERWRDESLKTTDEVREAYENVAARGLDALNDGIVDAIVNSKNLGEVFSNVAKQIIADLASIAVRQSITEPLANMLFGSGKSTESSSSGWLGKAASAIGGFFGGGRAFGGPVQGGMANRVGEHGPETLMMPGNGFVVPDGPFSAGNTTNGPRSGGGNSYTFSGNLMTPEFWAKVQGDIAAGEDRAYGRAVKDVPALAQSQTAKQQQHAVGRRRR